MNHPPTRHLPVRPNLDQLRRQAKELLEAYEAGEPSAVAEFQTFHPRGVAKLTDAQHALARSYGVASWPRLVTSCEMIEAIWANDVARVVEMVRRDPRLLVEDARAVKGNWGPPMSYAATAGRPDVVAALQALGAADVQYAFERACLKGELGIARRLMEAGARPDADSVMGPAETLNPDGLRFLLEAGAPHDRLLESLALVLQTYSRYPRGKHGCLEVLAEYGYALPDGPLSAFHRGRIDLLEGWLRRDPELLRRTFAHEEIWPRACGCHEDETLALHGAPLAGGTILHLAVDFDEVEIFDWALANGADPNVRAAIAADGFGGHTPLFGCVVSQAYRCGLKSDRFARALLERGADASIRASLRKALRFVEDERWHEFRDVTAREFGERFQDQDWVNPAVMRLLA